MQSSSTVQGTNSNNVIIITIIIKFSWCLLTCRLNSTGANYTIKPAQEHKYNTKTLQIYRNGTLNKQKTINMVTLRKPQYKWAGAKTLKPKNADK